MNTVNYIFSKKHFICFLKRARLFLRYLSCRTKKLTFYFLFILNIIIAVREYRFETALLETLEFSISREKTLLILNLIIIFYGITMIHAIFSKRTVKNTPFTNYFYYELGINYLIVNLTFVFLNIELRTLFPAFSMFYAITISLKDINELLVRGLKGRLSTPVWAYGYLFLFAVSFICLEVIMTYTNYRAGYIWKSRIFDFDFRDTFRNIYDFLGLKNRMFSNIGYGLITAIFTAILFDFGNTMQINSRKNSELKMINKQLDDAFVFLKMRVQAIAEHKINIYHKTDTLKVNRIKKTTYKSKKKRRIDFPREKKTFANLLDAALEVIKNRNRNICNECEQCLFIIDAIKTIRKAAINYVNYVESHMLNVSNEKKSNIEKIAKKASEITILPTTSENKYIINNDLKNQILLLVGLYTKIGEHVKTMFNESYDDFSQHKI